MTHTYTYDALNRLATAKGTLDTGGISYDHTGTNSYQYDRIGNITYKPNVGSYNYNYSNKPHAVNSTTGAVNINLLYDSNGNMYRVLPVSLHEIQ